ncbi:unnamed protein product [Schistosoma rodhaini]|uniref:Ras-associating domain-containing protein n=1 Tax=Schistosoma rodhaini TaxID=6188 RepID=A0AA85G1Z0_9TREM|nr:unnamed protein product [Schistosoma rodhaini]CAH8599672.1 unnamed protein product [Schistosoma rodhaini]
MDIKVNIDGVLREVCGINEGTTCEEVIFKLAQIASLPGFYTLVASCRDKEITLSPEERIINFIKETKENPSNICFILRRLEAVSPFSPKVPKAYPPVPNHQPTSRPHQQPSRSLSRRSNVPVTSENKELCSSTSSSLPIPAQHCVSSTKQSRIYRCDPSCELIHSSLITSAAGEEKSYHDVDQYNQLKDQLAYQEQQVELNRIRLLRLDKEINHLEQSARFGGNNNNSDSNNNKDGYSTLDLLSGSAVGPVAELAQLAATPWSQLLDTNRARQRELLSECERHKIAIDQVDTHLAKTKMNLSQLENQINQELNRLLNELEGYNQHRRLLLKSAGSGSSQPRPSDGVAV